jgi:hypothetical protein
MAELWRPEWARRMKEWMGLSRLNDLPSPVILWKGVSRLDGESPVLVAACVSTARPSKNEKTGDMIQIAIMRSDMSPIDAWVGGRDGAVCPASCIHRSKARGGQGSCYVNKARLRSAWEAARDQDSLPVYLLPVWARGARLRFGMEGDPAAVPLEVWQALAKTARSWSGYTAHWREVDVAWQQLFMASCGSSAEATEAEALGWRTFSASVSSQDDEAHTRAGRKVCHAISVGLDCTACRGCDGHFKGALRPSFHLPLHGAVGAAMRRRSDQIPLFEPVSP